MIGPLGYASSGQHCGFGLVLKSFLLMGTVPSCRLWPFLGDVEHGAVGEVLAAGDGTHRVLV